jgi:ribonucleotide reductase small subunit/SCP-2 sterol transfer family protein
MAAVAIPRSTEQISYEDLYRRWERGNWRATEIDLSQDRIDWHERFTPEQRRGALWLYSLFFHGEDSVADNLSPYIDAAPNEEQAYFLTTQQVDEARHAVFFRRFMHEVVGVGDGSTGGTLAATAGELSWGHRKVFGRLDAMAAELRADRSPRKLASAVTLYHIVIEASLAQPGQHIIERTLEDMDMLPGFREGMGHVALDEQRHIAFGVRLLADLYRDDPERIQDAIVSTIREVLPWTTATGWPPDRGYTECFGFAVEDIYEEGARAQEARLRAVGLPVDEIVPFPLPMDKTPRERAERGILLLSNGYIGEKTGPASRDPEVMSVFFDQVRRGADPTQVPSGTTIQWDFTDAPPWLLTVDGAGAQIEQRRADKPTLTLKLAYQDFIDLSAGRVDPRRLVLTRRLRPRGDLRMLLRLPRLFP